MPKIKTAEQYLEDPDQLKNWLVNNFPRDVSKRIVAEAVVEDVTIATLLTRICVKHLAAADE